MNCASSNADPHATASSPPPLDPATRCMDRGTHTAGGGHPLLTMSAALPTCDITAPRGASDTSSTHHSPVLCGPCPTRRRAATRPPEPVTTARAGDGTQASSSSSAAAAVEGTTEEERLLCSLIERFTLLLLPATERLIRLRAALRGLRDGLVAPSPSPSASPTQPHDLLAVSPSPRPSGSANAATNSGPPRLCVTGLSDVEVDEVFHFVLHRDPTAARGGSAGFGGGRSALSSAGSAMRPPTPDYGGMTSAHVSPATPGPLWRSRADLTAASSVSAGGGMVGGSTATATSGEGISSTTVSPTASAAMTGSVSGLLSSSNATLSDGVPETAVAGPTGDFPSTPPPPPMGFSRAAAEANRGHVSPRLTDSPSPEHFALPVLHHRSESGILKANTHDKNTLLLVEGRGAPHLGFASLPTSGATVRVPAAPASATAVPHPCSVSPHALLILGTTRGEEGGAPPNPAMLLATPSPPLPAAPVNHHLRGVWASPSLESCVLNSPTAPTCLREEDGTADTLEGAKLPPSVQDFAAASVAAELSSTMPDLGDTPHPAGEPPPPPLSSVAALVPHTPNPTTHTTTTTPPFGSNSPRHRRSSGGGVSTLAAHPMSSCELSESPLDLHSGTGAGIRRRTAPHPLLPPVVSGVHASESPTTSTPIVTVLLHRTASQYSESSDHQRSFLGNSPSPGTGRFNTLPTPFLRVSGAASSTGRSFRDDSTLLSPGSSFSPAAARFVQRLRRRTVVLNAAHMHFSAWDLFHPELLTEQDRALLQASRTSFTAAGSPERLGRGSKGGLASKRGSGDGSTGSRLHHRRSSSQQTFNAAPTTSAPPWSVGISEDGVLRCEALPTATASPPYARSPPITSTADYCLLCIPFDEVYGLSRDPDGCADYTVPAAAAARSTAAPTGAGIVPAAAAGPAAGGEISTGVAGDAEEVTRALNLLFGPFAGPKPRQRSAAPAASILVTGESASNPGLTGAGAGGGGGSVGGTPVLPPSSPPLSTLAFPNHEAGATFVFPALGRVGSGNDGGVRGVERSRCTTPTPSFEKAADSDQRSGAAAGSAAVGVADGDLDAVQDGGHAHAQRAESAQNSLSSASARTAATFPQAVTDRLGGGGGGGGGGAAAATMRDECNDSYPALAPRASDDTTTTEWLCPLRQALIHRVMFVLVKEELPSSIPPPPPPHSPKKASRTEDGTPPSSTTAVPDTHATAVRNFVGFVKAQYGVTVPSWRVVVFSYRSSVSVRNLLLSYYAYFAQAEVPPHFGMREDVHFGEYPDAAVAQGETGTTVLKSTVVGDGTRKGERDSPALDLPPPTSPPLMNSHAPPQCAVSPLARSLLPTPPDTSAALSPSTLRGHRRESRTSIIHSISRLTLPNSLKGSTETPLYTPHAAGAFDDAVGEGETVEAATPGLLHWTRMGQTLFLLLAKDVNVPPLPTSLANYAPLMLRSGSGAGATSPSPPLHVQPSPLSKSPSLVPPNGMSPHGLSGDNGVAGSVEVQNRFSTAAAHHAASRAPSVSSATEDLQEDGLAALTTEEVKRSGAACRHALSVMWRESGAAALSAAFRFFEHDAEAHRLTRSAFSLMAWSWQLAALLPAVVREAQLRCSRLRHNQHQAAQRLEAVQKSIETHFSNSPAKTVAAMERRLQGEFAVLTQRFAHDVRRLLAASSSSPVRSRQASAAAAACPPMEALRVYDAPVLWEAYHRLTRCVQQFRDLYIHGHVPPETRCGDDRRGSAGAPEESGRRVGSAKGEGGLSPTEDGTRRRRNTSLYETRYRSLRAKPHTPEPLTKWCTSPNASPALSTRAASESASNPPPVQSGASGQSRGSRSAPPPPHVGDTPGTEEEHLMPRINRSTPRERRVSLVASVSSTSASASVLNNSSASRSRPSLEEVAATMSHDAAAVLSARVSGSEGSVAPTSTDNPTSGSTPVRPVRQQPSQAEVQPRRLLMERQLIVHISQLNTELINFFLATCVAALPHLHNSCVQHEVGRVKAAHAEMYSAFATAEKNRKDAAMAMSHMYAALEQWAVEVGPLLSMVRSRHYLEKFIVQLRAVLCEDQIRALAVFRDHRYGSRCGPTAQLTNVSLARHCTAIATADTHVQETAKRTAERCPPQRSQRVQSSNALRNPSSVAEAGGMTSAPQVEVGIRSARLLLYYTRLVCKPLHLRGGHTVGGGDEAASSSSHPTHGVDEATCLSSSVRPRGPASATTTTTPHTSISRKRGGGLGDTVSLTSMSAAWNREEEVSRNAGHTDSPRTRRSPARSGEEEGRSDIAGKGFYATPSLPCMAAVSAQLVEALSGAAAASESVALSLSVGSSAPPSSPTPQQRRGRAAVDLAGESMLTSSGTPSSRVASYCNRVNSPQQSPTSTAESADLHTHADGAAGAWQKRLAKWRARLSEAERPADISPAPLLWLLLDTWDEVLLRFPYGLLLQLDTARYADSLNALSKPVVEMQLNCEVKLKDSVKNAARQLTAAEADLKRLVGRGGELRPDYVAALKGVFDDATALAATRDDAVHASFFA